MQIDRETTRLLVVTERQIAVLLKGVDGGGRVLVPVGWRTGRGTIPG